MARKSISRAAIQALAAWLTQSLSKDITVNDQWPPAGVRLKSKTVSVIHTGRRQRGDSYGTMEITARTNISPTQAEIRIRMGEVTQPLQIDIWCTNDSDRDDVMAQLDQVLHAGRAETLNVQNSTQTVTSDPWSDDLTLPFDPNGCFAGDFCTFLFDDWDISDDVSSIEKSEYRTSLIGEAVMPFSVFKTVPRLINATFEQNVTQDITPTVYDTTTLTANGTPKPTVTHGKSSS
jgi:hypothetical protein